MTDCLSINAPLIRWQGNTGTYHLVRIEGEAAEAIAMHARLRRLEYGVRRGFGSVKVWATIGGTRWKSSVFPSKPDGWILLVSKKVMRAEGLAANDPAQVTLEPV